MKRLIFSLLLTSFFFYLFFLPAVFADESKRIVTVVSPVREKNKWLNGNSLEKQINLITGQNIPATWLTVYENLKDPTLVTQLSSLDSSQEIGLFLEVNEVLATDSLVAYLFGDGDWARPDKLFLSGYTLPERKRMIDTSFSLFRNKFGKYPKTVGAWYIDTFSLDYMVKRYGITLVMDCSDQYRTDKYGLWGKPWGVSYRPSFVNSLMPATRKEQNKVVTIQWAARDLVRGYGTTVADSTYSVQANDYIAHHNLQTDYFQRLASDYLFSPNSVTQLTVGLEVGQEGEQYAQELKRQIIFLKDLAGQGKISFQTASGFAQTFRQNTSDDYFLTGTDAGDNSVESYWYGNTHYRINLYRNGKNVRIRDLRQYGVYYFRDLYESDKGQILERYLPACIDEINDANSHLISSDVREIKYERVPSNVIMTIHENSGSIQTLVLSEEGISVNGKNVLSADSGAYSGIKDTLIRLGVAYNLRIDSTRYGSLAYSGISGVKYLGFFFPPESFIGLVGKFPFLRMEKMPFQVLTRFKNTPHIDPVNLLLENLVNHRNSCKMNL